MFHKDLVNLYESDYKYLTDVSLRLKFWRTAHRVKTMRNLTWFLKLPIVLTYYLKSYYNKKIYYIRERHKQMEISSISK